MKLTPRLSAPRPLHAFFRHGFSQWALSLLPALLCACWGQVALAETAADRPNVLVIVADDLGYADLGFQGAKDIPTPQLDKLAAQSVRFTSGYVSHSFCSPTRASLLTGRYQHRFGHETNPAWLPKDDQVGLPLTEVTLPQVLKKAGYATGAVGKWHLGAHPLFHPNRRGFDEYFGALGGGHQYFPGDKGGVEYTIPLDRNGQAAPHTNYLTLQFGGEAEGFVRRHAAGGKPWFLYLAFNAPHTPLQAPPEWVGQFSGITNEARRKYAAMVAVMDHAIGGVLGALADTGQAANTLVWFISDNGGPNLQARTGVCFTDNTPWRGYKGQVYEGGIRVPFLLRWPARLKGGTTFDEPVTARDIFATAVAVAGGAMPNDRRMDCVNLLPHVLGQTKNPPHELLIWRQNGPGGLYGARLGTWKLVRQGQEKAELYDLAADIGENSNVAGRHPEIVGKIEAALAAWDAETVTPKWQSPQGTRRPAAKQPQ